MTELLEKLKFKPTIKQVITGILTALLLVVFWEQGHELLIQFKVPNEYASELYIPLIFLISYLLAGLGLKCITSFNKDGAIKTKNNEFRTVVQKTLPQLPANHLEILKELSLEEQNLSFRRKGVSPLNRQNYIQKIHQTSLNEFIFKINPTVKDELDIFIKNEQNTNLKN